MSTLNYILVFSFIGSVGSLIGGLILLFKVKAALKITHLLASFATGTLLGTAFLDLLPEAAKGAEKTGIDIFLWTLLGMIIFFILERGIHFFHHHDDFHKHDRETRSIVPLIIVGDTLHNFIDGIVIAATFLVNIPLGIATSIAVAIHEIPQEIGDFGLMLHKGLSTRKVIWINIFSACASLLGAVLTYAWGDVIRLYIPVFLAVTAGFFIYIASADLIPEIHHEKRKGFAFMESALMLAGILTIFITLRLLEG